MVPETREGSRNAVISDEFAICGCHPVARGTPSRTSPSAAGHEGGPGTPFLRPRPKPAAGPRAVPELDGPGGSGWGDSTSPSPAHPHAVAEDGTAGRPGGVSRPLREDRGGMWVAPDELASAPHSTAVRGGAVGGAAAASSEPPGLRRPEASHPPAGRPEPRATSPALPIAGAGGKRPALRDGSPAPGRVPQMAVGRRKRPDHRPRGAGTVHCAVAHKDRAVGPVPPPDVAGPGHPTRGGPDGGVPRGWRIPTFRLSLSPSFFCLSPPRLFSLGPGPACYPGPSPDGEEDRHRSRRP